MPVQRGIVSDMEVVVVLASEGGQGDTGISDHPARDDVVSLLQQLVLDSLFMQPPSKPPSTIDFVLDVRILCSYLT